MRVLPLLLLATLGTIVVVASGSLAVDPPQSGDWVVDDDTVVSGTDVTVTGNVTVTSGGSLSLSRLTLLLNLSADGQYNILVRSGGRLELDGVTVDSEGGAHHYNLTVNGAAVIGNDSVIRHLDGTDLPSPFSDPRGLAITSSSVRVHNTTVETCRGFAVFVQPPLLAGDIEPVLEDCVIRNNGGGIYCGGLSGSGDAVVRGCLFYGNGAAEAAVAVADPVFSGCTFGQFGSFSLVGMAVMALAGPTVTGCTFQYLGVAMYTSSAEPHVSDTTFLACLQGLTVLYDDPTGGAPLVTGSTFSNCGVALTLNSTSAVVRDCVVGGLLTGGFPVRIDGGAPTLTRLEVSLGLFVSGCVSIVNGSRATMEGCDLAGAAGGPVVHAEDSAPTIRDCTIEGGSDGVELLWSPASVTGCTIQDNDGWGIASYYEGFTGSGNRFGSGGTVNGEGRVIQFHYLEAWVELEDGRPAVDATFELRDRLDDLVVEVATDDQGLALMDTLPAWLVTNANRTVTYTPHLAVASLGELRNETSVDISSNPTVVLVLRPVVNLPPLVELISPGEGGEYDVWQLGNRVPFEGLVEDPEGGDVTWAWFLDGELLEATSLQFELELVPGTYQVSLGGVDDRDQSVRVHHNFTVVSVPPADNYVRVVLPEEGAVYDRGAPVAFEAEQWVQDHPELEGPAELPVTWSSSIDGELFTGETGEVADLTPGVHVITATVVPRYPEYIPSPYNDSVTIEVLPPPPLAVANISSPSNGTEYMVGEPVHLSAEGSTLEIWDPPDHRIVYRWSSDLDGDLGEGEELEARYLSVGTHVVTLKLTTDPFIVSDSSSVTLVVLPPPNRPPLARITLQTERPVAGGTVRLSGVGSVDPDGDMLTLSWRLGDGNSSTGRDVNHTYSLAGNYTVNLTVSDGQMEGWAEMVVEVHPAPDGGNGGNGGDGDDDDGGVVEPDADWQGWLLIILLFSALGVMLYIAWRQRQGT